MTVHKKMIVGLFVVVVMWLLPVSTAVGQPSIPDQVPEDVRERILEKVNVNGQLVNEQTGEIMVLQPTAESVRRVGESTYAVEYFVGIKPTDVGGTLSSTTHNSGDIPFAFFPKAVSASSDETASSCDDSYSWCTTLELHYVDGGTWIRMDKVRNTWTRHDPSVSASSAYIRAACYEEWYNGSPDGSSICNKQSTGWVGTPSSGATYVITPYWNAVGYELVGSADGLSGIQAYQEVTLTRYSSSWTWYTCVQYGGDRAVAGCS